MPLSQIQLYGNRSSFAKISYLIYVLASDCDNSKSLCLRAAREKLISNFTEGKIQDKSENKGKAKFPWTKTHRRIAWIYRRSIRQLFPCSKVTISLLYYRRFLTTPCRYHPLDDKIIYTVINTSPPRTRKTKAVSRQAFICKWEANSWTVEKFRKVGDKGLTCFDVR